MKSKLDPLTTADEKFARFKSALRSVLRVSKSDLNEMLAEEKKASAGKPKPGPKPKHRG